jgi:hypothetical protein
MVHDVWRMVYGVYRLSYILYTNTIYYILRPRFPLSLSYQELAALVLLRPIVYTIHHIQHTAYTHTHPYQELAALVLLRPIVAVHPVGLVLIEPVVEYL